ncbi:MAG TPA: ABC-F family ATP-binding cassette domain-containing protein [Streptosporangiaceae bacterium]|jgi:ABC transport system ATP-binding/permease protein|nr:ABC-F family ATP-binding cassette domain-containing protein [Streptosporangiaceae bacterium]
MNLVNLEQAAKAYHERVLLDGVSLGVAAGQRIGVVGRNGAGKTTLLAALAGTAELDSGRTTRARDVTIGYLPQSEQLTGTVGSVVFGGVAEHEWAADPRSRAVVEALLGDIDTKADVSQLSGGERRRSALAALLRSSYDLLLLDEPTNHLDIEAITWLAGYLRQHAASFVVVTHDRWFLDAVTDETWEVAGGQVHAYEGGYSAYVLAKAERARIAAAMDQRHRNLLRKELAWLRRGPPARTSKPKFRIEAASALIADEPPARDSVELARLATTRLGKTVVELEDVSATAGPRVLIDHVSWQLGPGDRVGIVGVNGTGKTTLLRLLAGTLPVPSAGEVAATGRVITGATVQLGYLTQEPAAVDPDLRVLEAAEQVRSSAVVGGKHELSVSQLLDRLGLTSERQWTRVGDLSGGERRRLQLLLMLLAEPNVLLLDEPTNDLDIETLTELEDLMDGWPGSVVVVSHDRYFLERVTDHVLGLLGGQLAYLPGGVDEYLSRRAAAAEHRETAQAGVRASAGPGEGRAASQQRAGQKELARLERQIARLTAAETRLASELADNASDYAKLVELGADLRGVQTERASLEERWLEVAEDIS